MKRLSRSSDSDDSGGETDCDRSEQRGTRQKDKRDRSLGLGHQLEKAKHQHHQVILGDQELTD